MKVSRALWAKSPKRVFRTGASPVSRLGKVPKTGFRTVQETVSRLACTFLSIFGHIRCFDTSGKSTLWTNAGQD